MKIKNIHNRSKPDIATTPSDNPFDPSHIDSVGDGTDLYSRNFRNRKIAKIIPACSPIEAHKDLFLRYTTDSKTPSANNAKNVIKLKL